MREKERVLGMKERGWTQDFGKAVPPSISVVHNQKLYKLLWDIESNTVCVCVSVCVKKTEIARGHTSCHKP